jgi:hypothetical protein
MHAPLNRDVYELLRISHGEGEHLFCSIWPRGRGADASTIDLAERQLNCRFPPSYRLFLEEHNGGYMPDPLTKIHAVEQYLDVVRCTLEGRRVRTPHQQSPSDMEIVLANSDGNLICLDTSWVDYRGENPVIWALLGGERIHLGNSFLEFVERRLREDREN